MSETTKSILNPAFYPLYAALREVKFFDYQFSLVHRGAEVYLRALYEEPDIVTGKVEVQFTRKWRISAHMTKSEFLQTVFKCCLTSMEHRTREHFRYQGHAVYSPHYDVDALVELCKAKAFDYREAPPEPPAQEMWSDYANELVTKRFRDGEPT